MLYLKSTVMFRRAHIFLVVMIGTLVILKNDGRLTNLRIVSGFAIAILFSNDF